MAFNRYTVVLLYLFTFICGSIALSCDYCDRTNLTNSCGEPPDCNNGTALDACGCCLVCAKTENETCGGQWNIHGECADAFVCVPEEEAKEVLGADGIFRTKTPIGRCIMREEYLRQTKKCLQDLHRFLMETKSYSTRQDNGGLSKCRQKPNCTPEGWYMPIQCDKCKGECWCSDGNGNEIPHTRKHGRIYHC